MCPFDTQGHSSRTEKVVVKSELEFDFSVVVPDLVYNSQRICFKGNYFRVEIKFRTDGRMDGKIFSAPTSSDQGIQTFR